jgi:Ribbon-helix-helix protein, copG family
MAIIYTKNGQGKWNKYLTFGHPMSIIKPSGEDAVTDTKKTMTLNLTPAEMDALDELAKKKDLSKTALIRQALRLYQAVNARVSQGDKLFFENELLKKKAELMVLG